MPTDYDMTAEAEAAEGLIRALARHSKFVPEELTAAIYQAAGTMVPTAQFAPEEVSRILSNDQVPPNGRKRVARETVERASASVDEQFAKAQSLVAVAEAAVLVSAVPSFPPDADRGQAMAEFNMRTKGDIVAVMQLMESGDARFAHLALGSYGRTVFDVSDMDTGEIAHRAAVRATVITAEGPALLAEAGAALRALDAVPSAIGALGMIAGSSIEEAEIMAGIDE